MDTERLIALVRQREPLYNPLYPGYTDRDMKERLWIEVGEIMRAPAKECKTRWKTVRDSFQREIKAQQKMGGAYKRRRYIFFDQLMFLLPNLGVRKSDVKAEISYDSVESSDPDGGYADEEGSTSSGGQDLRTSHSSLVLPPGAEEPCVILTSGPTSTSSCNSTSTITPNNRRPICEQCKSPLLDERVYAFLEATAAPPDEDELFVRSLLPSLKRLKDQERSVLKIRISQLIHETLYGTRIK